MASKTGMSRLVISSPPELALVIGHLGLRATNQRRRAFVPCRLPRLRIRCRGAGAKILPSPNRTSGGPGVMAGNGLFIPLRLSASPVRVFAGRGLFNSPGSHLRFFTVDDGIGAKQRPFHGAMADAGDARRPHRIEFQFNGCRRIANLPQLHAHRRSTVTLIACFPFPARGINRSLGRSPSESA